MRYPPAPGGAETNVAALATGLRERGHEVVVHTSDLWSETPFRRARLPRRVAGVPIRRHTAFSPGGEAHYVLPPGMLPGLLREPADIVHTHSYGYFQNSVAWLRRQLQVTPWVLTPHFHPSWSMWGGNRRRRLRQFYDWLHGSATLRTPDAIISVSQHELKQLRQESGLPLPQATVIPNGIHWSDWAEPPRPEPLRAAYPQLGEQLVLYAGRLATNKGLPHLITALAHLRQTHPGVELLVVGQDMGVGAALDAQASAAGVSLHRLGHLSDELYRSAFAVAEVLALPSEYEAFGIVLLEAAAAGLPAVATRVGGVPEAIIEGETGLLVEYGDATALAAALAQILDDPTGARELGQLGRERARDEFSWASIVARVEQLYLGLL